MSDAATRQQQVKRHWAEPGSRHDSLIRAIKFGLPILIVVLVLLLAIAPFERRGDVSFILDKNEVEQARERMRLEQARYTGEDNKGQKFLIVADQAVQQSSDVPVVLIQGMRGQLNMERGPLTIAAIKGRYDLEQELVTVDGPIRVAAADGYQLVTRDVTIDLDRRTMRSSGAVSGQLPLGDFQAGSLSANLEDRTVRLEGGVRLKIVQGAVR
jgi:lipopolysaccharide export system protein LptC